MKRHWIIAIAGIWVIYFLLQDYYCVASTSKLCFIANASTSSNTTTWKVAYIGTIAAAALLLLLGLGLF